MFHLPSPAFVASAVVVSLLADAQAQGIRLVTVPATVRLPAAGDNLVLEAAIDGAAAEVWLATDLAATDRVPLAPAGSGRWQVNLADPRVAALLTAARERGTLFVFARSDGRTVQSAAVAWTRATRDDARVRCLVRGPNSTRTVEVDAKAWLDPAQLDRLELHGADARQAAAAARCGETTLPLQHHDDGTWVLANDANVRTHLFSADTVELEAKLGSRSVLFQFAIVPPRLALQDGADEFVVVQRGRKALPGSRGWLTVHLDDITMGRTLLRVVAADGGEVIATTEMCAGDFVPFALAEERYVLVVERLRNVLVGDDHAVLRVRPAEGFRPDRIAQLIRAVGASGDTFVRDGQEYPGNVARQFLVAKVANHRGEVTLEGFVTALASVSTTTGEAYRVWRKDGSEVTMEAWLRAALAAIEAEAAKAGAPRDR